MPAVAPRLKATTTSVAVAGPEEEEEDEDFPDIVAWNINYKKSEKKVTLFLMLLCFSFPFYCTCYILFDCEE